jgi:hypothetical protein
VIPRQPARSLHTPTTHRSRIRHRHAPGSLIGLFALAISAVLATTLAFAPAGPASAAQPGQRIDLKVLLLAATGTETGFTAWKAALEREGVPYETKIALQEPPFTDDTFADYAANRAKYQGVILATGDLVYNNNGLFVTALADSEWAALAKFQTTFGIRRLSVATFPGPTHGMNFATASGDQGGATAQLTPAGLAVFPYLKGPVPIDQGSFGYRATPASPATFTTLLQGPANSAFVGIYTHPDGRQEMVMTVEGNQYQTQTQLLRHGLLRWVTGGVYLGHQRNYFQMHIDDVFTANTRWNTGSNTTPCAEAPASPLCSVTPPIRMVPSDVDRALTWQQTTGIRLDMAFNGESSVEAAANAGGVDPLTAKFLSVKSAFRWINHTYTHLNLDGASQAVATDEIQRNVSWARDPARALLLNPEELVTGEHSGLGNPAMPNALQATGIRWIASDNSRQPEPYVIGPARTVPRYPSNLYYNVGTEQEQLDEYNHVYMAPPNGSCVQSSTNTCRTTAATWPEYVASEAGIMFRHVMDNDPRPHYIHQSNLAEQGVAYPVMNALLGRYNTYFSTPIEQLTQAQAGEEMLRQSTWKGHLAAGRVNAYMLNGQVFTSVSTPMDVPLTGTATGSLYGGVRSGWTRVLPPEVAPGASTPPAQGQPAVVGQAGGPAIKPAPGRPAAVRLGMSRLKVVPARVRFGRSVSVRWTLSSGARVTVTVQRKVGKRFVFVGRLVRSASAGPSSLTVKSRLGKRRLVPGVYRLLVTAQNSRAKMPARAVTFTVLKALPRAKAATLTSKGA